MRWEFHADGVNASLASTTEVCLMTNPSNRKVSKLMNAPHRSPLTRRAALKGLAATAAFGLSGKGADESVRYRAKNGRIKQSVIPWCFKPMPEEELVQHAAALGLQSVELI